jgi:hypothetical protein
VQQAGAEEKIIAHHGAFYDQPYPFLPWIGRNDKCTSGAFGANNMLVTFWVAVLRCCYAQLLPLAATCACCALSAVLGSTWQVLLSGSWNSEWMALCSLVLLEIYIDILPNSVQWFSMASASSDQHAWL